MSYNDDYPETGVVTSAASASARPPASSAAAVVRENLPNSSSRASIPTTLVYDSYSGADILVDLVLPNEASVPLGELQTFSYSMHRDNFAARTLGHVSPVGFAKGPRTIGGSMIFTVFNTYAFYRLEHYQNAIKQGLYPVADMLPPVDLNITLANEYGALSKMRLFGITFVDEGGAMSIDDMIIESTFSYMARGIQPLTGYKIPFADENGS